MGIVFYLLLGFLCFIGFCVAIKYLNLEDSEWKMWQFVFKHDKEFVGVSFLVITVGWPVVIFSGGLILFILGLGNILSKIGGYVQKIMGDF